MAYTRRDLTKGGAVQTTLNGGISSGATSCTLTATTGWPDGSPGAFYVVVDPGLATEEKILCSTRSSTTLNFTTRGADGTSAAAHASGAVIYPCLAAVDLDEANLAVSKLIGLATAVGQIPVVDNTNSFAMVQAKTSGSVLIGNGTTVASTALSGDVTVNGSGVTAIGATKVTAAMLVSTAVTPASYTNTSLTVDQQGRITAASSGTLGTLGYASTTTPQTGISTIADLTSLTSTVTVAAGRRVRITGYVPLTTGSAAGFANLYIYEGSTFLATAFGAVPTSGGGIWLGPVMTVLTPSTGSHTYKLRMSAQAGTVATNADSGTLYGPCWILVEDIGV